MMGLSMLLQWAERLLEGGGNEQWGDKWEERFKDGKGGKQVVAVRPAATHVPLSCAWFEADLHVCRRCLTDTLPALGVLVASRERFYSPEKKYTCLSQVCTSE